MIFLNIVIIKSFFLFVLNISNVYNRISLSLNLKQVSNLGFNYCSYYLHIKKIISSFGLETNFKHFIIKTIKKFKIFKFFIKFDDINVKPSVKLKQKKMS